MQPSATCEKKTALAKAAEAQRILYLDAAHEIGQVLSLAAFDKARARAEQSMAAYESAQRALEAHIKEHGC